MRKFMAGVTLISVLVLGSFITGCGGSEKEDTTLKSTAPINNNAPEAKDAPVAPRDPSIIMPGGGGGPGGKKKMAPPSGN